MGWESHLTLKQSVLAVWNLALFTLHNIKNKEWWMLVRETLTLYSSKTLIHSCSQRSALMEGKDYHCHEHHHQVPEEEKVGKEDSGVFPPPFACGRLNSFYVGHHTMANGPR